MLLHNPSPGWPDENIFLLLMGYHSLYGDVCRHIQAWLWDAKLDHPYLPLEGHSTHVCVTLQYTVEKKPIQPKLTYNIGIFKCHQTQNLAWINPQVVIQNYFLFSNAKKPSAPAPTTSVPKPNRLCHADLLEAGTSHMWRLCSVSHTSGLLSLLLSQSTQGNYPL